MIDKEYWEDELKSLSYDELIEIEKIVNELKEKSLTKEELIDVLKRWKMNFPDAKYFCLGYTWKGAYECEGEWGAGQWQECYDCCDMIFRNYDSHDDGTKSFIKQFKTCEEFEKVCLNTYVDRNNEFENDIENALHVPVYNVEDAEYNNNGETCYEFINIETGERFSLSTSAY